MEDSPVCIASKMDGISESITPIKIKEEDPSVLVGEFGLPSVSWLNIQHFGFFTLLRLQLFLVSLFFSLLLVFPTRAAAFAFLSPCLVL